MRIWEFACVMTSAGIAAFLALSPAWGGGEAEPPRSVSPPPAVFQVSETPIAPDPILERLTFGSGSAASAAPGTAAPATRASAPGAPPILLGISTGVRPTAYLSTAAGPAKARPGDVVDGWKVLQLRPTSVVLEREGQRIVVRMFSR